MSAIANTRTETLNKDRCSWNRMRALYLNWMQVRIERCEDGEYKLVTVHPGYPSITPRAAYLARGHAEALLGNALKPGESSTQVWRARELSEHSEPLALAWQVRDRLEHLSTSQQQHYYCEVVERFHDPRRASTYELSRSGRRELGEAVRRFLKAEHEDNWWSAMRHRRNDVKDILNDAEADSSVLDNLPVTGITYCEDCGHFEQKDVANVGRSGATGVCDACVSDGDYVYCEDTDRYISRSDAYERDDGEYYEDEGNVPGYGDDGLQDYSTDVCDFLQGPEFISSEDGPFTIGVELEVYAKGSRYRGDLIRHVSDHHGDDIICKSDGSLDGSVGVELVTRPLAVGEALNLFRNMELPEGTAAWDAGSCGMHVHIDARAFNEASLAKFMSFWNDMNNLELIRQVAGRHPARDSQATSYAALDDMDFTDDVVSRLKKSDAGVNRYRAVNLTNLRTSSYERLGLDPDNRDTGSSDTVEVRIFRASLRKERLLAQIEMAAAVVYFARDDEAKDQSEKEFRKWLKRNASDFPALASYLAPKSKLKAKEGSEHMTEV